MLRNIRNKKAQNTAEYAILIALVIGGVVAMQTYAQRALQARVRDTSRFMTNAIGGALINDGSNTYSTGQYEPYYSNTTEQVDKSTNEVQQKVDDAVTAAGTVLTNKTLQTDRVEYNGVKGE